MKKILILMIAFAVTKSSLLYSDNRSFIEKGNKEYAEKKYEEAIKTYETILSGNVASPAVYFNLGNAYYKMNDIPSAILNYERAKKISPSDEDVEFNLKLANLKITDKIEPRAGFVLKNWLHTFSSSKPVDQWATYCIVSFFIAIIFLTGLFFTSAELLKKLSFFMFIASVGYSLFCFLIALEQYNYLQEQNEAIVFSASVTVKSAPSEDGTNLFVIHSGIKLNIDESNGEWSKVSLANGNLGWVKTDTFKKI